MLQTPILRSIDWFSILVSNSGVYIHVCVYAHTPFNLDTNIRTIYVYRTIGGYAPFADESMPEQYRKIRRGLFEFHVDYWSDVSEQAKDLISRLLVGMPFDHSTLCIV